MPRRVTLRLGFAGGTRDVAVVIPDDEPTPWQFGERFTVVGTAMPRIDGPLKAAGAAKYSYDIDLPGTLPTGQSTIGHCGTAPKDNII